MVGKVERAVIVNPAKGKWTLNTILCLKYKDTFVDLNVHIHKRRIGHTTYKCYCGLIINGLKKTKQHIMHICEVAPIVAPEEISSFLQSGKEMINYVEPKESEIPEVYDGIFMNIFMKGFSI